MAGNGHLPKNFPKAARVLLRIEWDRFSVNYRLRYLGPHPEDAEFLQKKNYRSYGSRLEVSTCQTRNAKGVLQTGYREDTRCDTLTLYEPAELAEQTADSSPSSQYWDWPG